jgi:hypothetical protein
MPFLLAPILILVVSVCGLGSVTGKIAGVVRDKATGEPLPSADIVIVGTNSRASTDIDGAYLILNVEPGTYDLHFTAIGYRTVTVRDVVVQDLAKELSLTMEQVVLMGEEVTMVSERAVADSHPSTDMAATADAMGTATDIQIRGDRLDEGLYLVDGLEIKDSLICDTAILSAQNPYIQEGSIGTQKVEKDTSQRRAFAFIPIEEWIGEKFIFLPRKRSLKDNVYESFTGGTGKNGNPTYQECVGRIGTIIEAAGPGRFRAVYKIVMKMDDNGQMYTARSLFSSISGIALLADMDSARARWIGKTLWYASFVINTFNAEKGEEGFIQLKKKYVPLKVIDIVAGWEEQCPVRFILRTDSGEEGYVDCSLSNTNAPESYINNNFLSFENHFLERDPRVTYKWSSRAWSAIEKAKVFIGMTAQQARMSWGEPDKINRTISGSVKREQWVYHDGTYLYFENGSLTSIQN